MRLIKTYESFETDNSKIYIIGIPSGEALQVTRENLDNLLKESLIFYTTKYAEIGFFAFEDENIEVVKRYVDKDSKTKKGYHFSIGTNNFDKLIINDITIIIEQYRYKKNINRFWVSDDYMIISWQAIDFKNKSCHYTLEIELRYGDSAKYLFIKKVNEKAMDKYYVPNDRVMMARIIHELDYS